MNCTLKIKIILRMADPRWKFKRFEPRQDIGDIKERCFQQSRQAVDQKERWRTNYRDNYIRHPLGRPMTAQAPPCSIHLGGGPLAPTEEEMRSDYQNTYIRRDVTRPQTGTKMEDSRLFEYNFPMPATTSQAANDEVSKGRKPYDNSELIERRKDSVSTHFLFGDDPGTAETQYTSDFKAHPTAQRQGIDNKLWKSSISFDKDAGYGPNTKHRLRDNVPEKPDAIRPNNHQKNFDVGYDKPGFRTTYADSHVDTTNFKRPPISAAPPCAVLSDHGDAAGKWGSIYSRDYVGGDKIPNEIDVNELKRTHIDMGHDASDWSRREMATTPRRPKQEHMDLQKSNIVFKGDGEGRYDTTSKDLLGVYDRNQDASYGQFPDARADHLHLGSDPPNWESTASAANRLAGQGKPATQCPDLYRRGRPGFATGGAWDPIAGKDLISEKRWKPAQQPDKLDGSYFRQTHFELDATAKNKPRYKTEYFEKICRPKIEQ